MSDSPQAGRLLHPWDLPGKSTAMRSDQKNNNNICDSWEQVKYQEFGRGLFQPSWMTLRGS